MEQTKLARFKSINPTLDQLACLLADIGAPVTIHTAGFTYASFDAFAAAFKDSNLPVEFEIRTTSAQNEVAVEIVSSSKECRLFVAAMEPLCTSVFSQLVTRTKSIPRRPNTTPRCLLAAVVALLAFVTFLALILS